MSVRPSVCPSVRPSIRPSVYVNKPKSVSGDTSCSVECGPPCKWLQVFWHGLFILQNVDVIVLEMQRCSWSDPSATQTALCLQLLVLLSIIHFVYYYHYIIVCCCSLMNCTEYQCEDIIQCVSIKIHIHLIPQHVQTELNIFLTRLTAAHFSWQTDGVETVTLWNCKSVMTADWWLCVQLPGNHVYSGLSINTSFTCLCLLNIFKAPLVTARAPSHWFCPSVRLLVCLSPTANAIFSQTKQFRAMSTF